MLSAWLPILAGAVLAAALAVANNAPGPAVALCAVGGGLARAIRWGGLELGGIDPVTAARAGFQPPRSRPSAPRIYSCILMLLRRR